MDISSEILPIIDVKSSDVTSQPNEPTTVMMSMGEFTKGQNLLRLKGVDDLQRLKTERLFNAIAFIAETMIGDDPELRKELAKNQSEIEFPPTRIDETRRFGLKWSKELLPELGETAEKAVFYRTDSSGKGAGFIIRHVLGSHQIMPLDFVGSADHDVDEKALLAEAVEAVNLFASEKCIKPYVLRRQSEDPHMSDENISRLVALANKEQRLSHRTIQSIKKIGKSICTAVYSSVSVETNKGLERKLSKAKLSALGVILSLPFSAPLAVNAVDTIYENITAPDPPTAEQQYDSQNIDVSGVKPLANYENPIQHADFSSEGAEAFEIETPSEKLHGRSPRNIRLGANLEPYQCQLLPISSDIPISRIRIFTSNRRAAKNITTELTSNGVFICSDDASPITSDEAALVFDEV